MAPQEEPKKGGKEGYIRVTNWIKRKLRKRGWLLSHLKERHVEARINVEKELAKEGILTIFQTKMSLLWTIEGIWGEFKDYWLKLQEEYKKVGFIRHPSMAYQEATYCKFGTRHPKPITAKTKKDFMKILERIPDEAKLPLDDDTLKNIDRIRIDVKDKDGKNVGEVWAEYPVPIAAPLEFWSSMINNRDNFCNNYMVTYTGFTRAGSWVEEYSERAAKAIDEFMSKLPDKDDPKVQANLGTVKKAFGEVMTQLFNKYMARREKDIFGRIKTIGDAATDLEDLRHSIEDRRPDKFVNIYFKHTYKIIDPDMIMYPLDYDRLIELEEKVKKGGRNALVVDIDKGINEKEELDELEERWGGCIKNSDLKPIKREGRWERVPGLDENGWPLEVTYPGYKFNGWTADGYYVLLDIFNQTGNLPGNARKVDEKFVVDMDLLLMANCMNNEWDAIRDDVRDGRYHTESLTVLDYLMITIPKDDWASGIAGWRWVEGQENKLKDPTFAEGFRTLIMTYFDGVTRKGIRVRRKPNNLIPGFDKRAIIGKKENAREEFIHLGRKYYYAPALRIWDVTEDDKKQEGVKNAIGPTLSTRGISMYIINKVLFGGMKFYDEARRRLVKIAQDRGVWYDYGPRDFGVKALAPDGTPDPMNLDLTSANNSLDKSFVYKQFKSAIQKVEEK